MCVKLKIANYDYVMDTYVFITYTKISVNYNIKPNIRNHISRMTCDAAATCGGHKERA